MHPGWLGVGRRCLDHVGVEMGIRGWLELVTKELVIGNQNKNFSFHVWGGLFIHGYLVGETRFAVENKHNR